MVLSLLEYRLKEGLVGGDYLCRLQGKNNGTNEKISDRDYERRSDPE